MIQKVLIEIYNDEIFSDLVKNRFKLRHTWNVQFGTFFGPKGCSKLESRFETDLKRVITLAS